MSVAYLFLKFLMILNKLFLSNSTVLDIYRHSSTQFNYTIYKCDTEVSKIISTP